MPADFTLAQLHRVIQAVMGWENYHLHQFTVARKVYGMPDPDYDDRSVIDDRTVRLRELKLSRGSRLDYLYDFGDDWLHILQLEEVLQTGSDDVGPLCLAGECATPPEDVGGPLGYQDFLEALSDPNHERHDELKSWFGGPFDPKSFSINDANRELRRRFRRRKTMPKGMKP